MDNCNICRFAKYVLIEWESDGKVLTRTFEPMELVNLSVEVAEDFLNLGLIDWVSAAVRPFPKVKIRSVVWIRRRGEI